MTIQQVPKLTPELWRQLNAEGKSNKEIAEITGKAPQTVASMLAYYGIEKPQTIGQRMWPWSVEGSDHLHAAACQHLRRHSLWMTDGRTGMSLVRKKRLRNFYEFITREKKVVEFHPEFPPVAGVSSKGGWAYQDREIGDEDLIIRINPLVVPEVDDEFREFWSIPDMGEWPKLIGKYN